MGKTDLLAKLANGFKNWELIYRFRADPGMPRGGIVPPTPVLAPGSALRSRPRVALSSAQAPSVSARSRPSDNSRLGRCRAFLLRGAPPRLGRGQLPLPLRPDRLLTTGQLVRRRHVADRAVQANRVVVRHELGDQSSSIVHAQGGLDADALSYQGLEPPLHLAVALRVVWRGFDMSYSADADELLEVPGDELRAVVRDDPRPLAGVLLARPLEDRLHLGFGHRLADLPGDEGPAVAVQDAAQEEEGPADVEVGDIDVPVLVGPHRLLEARPLLGRLSPTAREFAGRLEDPVDAGGTDGHDVGVQHHISQPPIPFQGVTVLERKDGGLLPVLQPGAAREGSVVPVGGALPSAPATELAQGDPQPSDQDQDREPGARGPVPDELDHGITGGRGNPSPVQSSPSSFFSSICSSMSSERTSCLRWSFC